MKKIPTLFQRVYKNHKVVGIESIVTPGCQKVLDGLCVPTVKYDGSCCAIIDHVLYKRYDCKKGRKAPEGAIPCCDPDPITRHWPHWVVCDSENPSDKWFIEAFNNTLNYGCTLMDGTYEAIGPHFQGNPYDLDEDMLMRHGIDEIGALKGKHTFNELDVYLRDHNIEGIVWWDSAGPVCKLKRTDFGYKWPLSWRRRTMADGKIIHKQATCHDYKTMEQSNGDVMVIDPHGKPIARRTSFREATRIIEADVRMLNRLDGTEDPFQ